MFNLYCLGLLKRNRFTLNMVIWSDGKYTGDTNKMLRQIMDKELRETRQWASSRHTAESRAARQQIMERLFLTLSPLETLHLRDSMLARLERYKCSTH